MRRRDLLRAASGAVASLPVATTAAGRRTADRAARTGGCGERTTTDRVRGSVSRSGQGVVHEYGLRTERSCELVVSLSGPSDADFDLYVTLDGREPTRRDYDHRSRAPGSDERVALTDAQYGPGTRLGILVYAYEGTGTYTLDVEESGDGSADGGLDAGGASTQGTNAAPRAAFSVDRSPVPAGEAVAVDAGASSDPDGSVESYEWSFGDGATATGATATHTYDDPGEYELSVTVTDDAGDEVTAATTVTVGDPAASTETTTFSGQLSSIDARGTHTYSPKTTAPRRVTLELDGADARDFDLYVTTDGRTPTLEEFDHRSWTYENGEKLVLEGIDPGAELGVMVDAWKGTGSYQLTVTEENAPVSGTCGTATAAARFSGSVDEGGQTQVAYTPQTDSPCRVAATLSGPEKADLDLYATADGSQPTPEDADAASEAIRGRDRLELTPGDGDDVAFLIDARDGGGSYRLDVREFGG